MTDRDYFWPGMAALSLVLLVPGFWFFEWSRYSAETYASYLRGGLRPADGVFLAMGGLTVFVYLSLRRILHDQQSFRRADLPIVLLAVLTAVFHLGVFGMTVAAGSLDWPEAGSVFTVFWIASLVSFGILDLVLAAMLLGHRHESPALVTVFAVLTLIQGIAEISVIGSFIVPIVLPLALLVLGLHFLRRPETVEFV